MLTSDFSRVLSICCKDTNTRVRKGILSGSEIHCGIRENAKYLDGIRDLTVTRQAGFAKVLAPGAVLGKKKRCSGLKWHKFKIQDCREKEARMRKQEPPSGPRKTTFVGERQRLTNKVCCLSLDLPCNKKTKKSIAPTLVKTCVLFS